MTKKKYSAAIKKAEETNDKIYDFIDTAKKENPYSYAGLIIKNLLKVIKEKETGNFEINDILFELNIECNIKAFKVDSLAEEMKLESFLNTLMPYENDRQAKILFQ